MGGEVEGVRVGVKKEGEENSKTTSCCLVRDCSVGCLCGQVSR